MPYAAYFTQSERFSGEDREFSPAPIFRRRCRQFGNADVLSAVSRKTIFYAQSPKALFVTAV
jgi:hypothetical protein